MRTLSVVITSPRFNRGPRLSQAQEPVCIQALVTKSSVERLDITVLHRLAGINKAKQDFSLLTPGSHHTTHKFGSMIHPDLLRPVSIPQTRPLHTRDSTGELILLFGHVPRTRITRLWPSVPRGKGLNWVCRRLLCA